MARPQDLNPRQKADYDKAVAEANKAEEDGDARALEEALLRVGDALAAPEMGR